MKLLTPLLIVALSPLLLAEEPAGDTIAGLLDEIRRELPKGWSASYDPKSYWLGITRDEKVLSRDATPNAPHEEDKARAFSVYLVVKTKMETFQRKRAQNLKTQEQLNKLYKALVKMKTGRKFDSFFPETAEQKTAVMRYKALKETLQLLPDYYYRDCSLSWIFSSPKRPGISITNDRIRKECTDTCSKVVNLLSTY